MRYEPTFGEYVKMRLKEENLTVVDLDIDTIDFFHQQWLIERKEIILTDEQIRRSKILQ
tara:strand:+ start:229 stop:405 length:177 start_codon:yes stop_codon:yes gene_type:complete